MTTDQLTKLIAETQGYVMACPPVLGDGASVWSGLMKGDTYLTRLPDEIVKCVSSIDAIRELVLKECEKDDKFGNRFHGEINIIAHGKGIAWWKLTASDWCIAFLKAKGKI